MRYLRKVRDTTEIKRILKIIKYFYFLQNYLDVLIFDSVNAEYYLGNFIAYLS